MQTKYSFGTVLLITGGVIHMIIQIQPNGNSEAEGLSGLQFWI